MPRFVALGAQIVGTMQTRLMLRRGVTWARRAGLSSPRRRGLLLAGWRANQPQRSGFLPDGTWPPPGVRVSSPVVVSSTPGSHKTAHT